ncbi:hypothetical protein [Acetobacter senegalensis]|uniref:hypothetical protein n=1 Tax=Acetobacter senegalensis TaxID=446692 RepID=UPI00264C8625|nr:hypothetical protein [Acetobacter senegalensis]MDN7351536.1 hypothetical protein [Acetobacter senegalensis]MDN7351547.1 hypothetical protein [Acetobacter senegalensis]
MTATKVDPAQAKPAKPDRTKPPVLLTAVGRQRTGKTVFLNALTETVIGVVCGRGRNSTLS